MTTHASTVRSVIVGLTIALSAATLLGAWTSKESVADHKADVQAIHADFRRVLDLLCDDHPLAQQCRVSP